ncbi:hypothetical protein J1N35_006950 [Gossypium stocksii]|uniref:Uncharacterized protein n=1 Tax=Gossypium stocksii TaxID=47602 RepID=A0A9D3W639_9ROSI|nr:hypothetical protein J1N35_006950 [Gossypium stocksii]
MDSEGKQNHKESSASLKRETVQELEINASLPTLGSDNPELGTEALTRVVREMLEKVFETSLERNGDSVQGGCENCKKRRNRNSLKLESHSAKCVRTYLSYSKVNPKVLGSSLGVRVLENFLFFCFVFSQ